MKNFSPNFISFQTAFDFVFSFVSVDRGYFQPYSWSSTWLDICLHMCRNDTGPCMYVCVREMKLRELSIFFLIFTFNIPIKSIHRSSECVNVFNYISLHMFVCVYWSLVHCAQRLPTRQKERTEIRANERSTREILVESGSTFYTYYYVFDSLCYAYIHHTHSHMTPHSCSSMCLWSLLGALWFSKF